MHRTCILLLAISASVTPTFGQADEPKPKVSPDPLTEEQIAIYRVVLLDYLKDAKSTINLADITDTLDDNERSFNGGCPRNDSSQARTSDAVVHRFSFSPPLDTRVKIVDPDQQQKQIAQNDPQNLLKKAIDGHENVSEKQLDDSVKTAFRTGLFSFSEIVFDKNHEKVLLKYAFVCGGLCGHGHTLILKKSGGTWKIIKTCSSWVS